MITETPFKFSPWDEPALKMNEGNIMPHSCQELEGTGGKTQKTAGRDSLGARLWQLNVSLRDQQKV